MQLKTFIPAGMGIGMGFAVGQSEDNYQRTHAWLLVGSTVFALMWMNLSRPCHGWDRGVTDVELAARIHHRRRLSWVMFLFLPLLMIPLGLLVEQRDGEGIGAGEVAINQVRAGITAHALVAILFVCVFVMAVMDWVLQASDFFISPLPWAHLMKPWHVNHQAATEPRSISPIMRLRSSRKSSHPFLLQNIQVQSALQLRLSTSSPTGLSDADGSTPSPVNHAGRSQSGLLHSRHPSIDEEITYTAPTLELTRATPSVSLLVDSESTSECHDTEAPSPPTTRAVGQLKNRSSPLFISAEDDSAADALKVSSV